MGNGVGCVIGWECDGIGVGCEYEVGWEWGVDEVWYGLGGGRCDMVS